MLEPFLKFFVVFFVVVDPIALVPVFAGLTEGATAGEDQQQRDAQRPEDVLDREPR